MSEHYTEQARRALFFARYEAFELGSPFIETEHLLLALFRDEQSLTARVFERARLSLEGIRQEVKARTARTQRSRPQAMFRSARTRATCSHTQRRKPDGSCTNG